MADTKTQINNFTEIPNETPFVAHPYFQNRELSWLEFNKRVLDQARDESVPLLERLNFCSIFWSNLKEFFMVRVGSLSDLALVKSRIIDKKTGWTPAEQLEKIYSRCHDLYPYFEQTYSELQHRLKMVNVERVSKDDLTEDQKSFLSDWFNAYVQPFLSPQIVNPRHPFPHLTNGDIYIIVRLNDKTQNEPKKDKHGKKVKTSGAKNVTLGIIPLPSQTPRVIELPTDEGNPGFQFVLLEDLIESFAEEIFSMYKVKHTNIICVTRNADLDVLEGEEEQGVDYREHMKRILKKRSHLHPVRLESAKPLSEVVRKELCGRLGLEDHQTFVTKVPLDLSYTSTLEKRIKSKRLAQELTYEPFSPQWPLSINKKRNIINQLQNTEFLISYPYESIDALIMLLKEAAVDPAVVSIKITLYRLASHSKLAEALITAAENGKEVTALFELRARFDESNNIEWSQQFENAGCNVIYGFQDYKVHSKICLITRQTETGTQHITQLGTGNYNEQTAKLYTDFCFITTDRGIGEDAALFFQNMQMETLSDEYKTLWVAPMQIKQHLIAEIDNQIALQRAGFPSGIFVKTNSITDEDIINKLVEASQAGVVSTCLVRGISCILPGVQGYTNNVCIVSIVGRLLEHSRIYIFGSMDGEVKVILSSADLMTRNLDKRVEIAWEVKNESLKNRIIEYCGVCLSDTEKLRALREDGSYTPIRSFRAEGDMNMDSQQWLISESQRKAINPRANDYNMFHEAETVEIQPKDEGAMNKVASAFSNFVQGFGGHEQQPTPQAPQQPQQTLVPPPDPNMPQPRSFMRVTPSQVQAKLSSKIKAVDGANVSQVAPQPAPQMPPQMTPQANGAFQQNVQAPMTQMPAQPQQFGAAQVSMPQAQAQAGQPVAQNFAQNAAQNAPADPFKSPVIQTEKEDEGGQVAVRSINEMNNVANFAAPAQPKPAEHKKLQHPQAIPTVQIPAEQQYAAKQMQQQQAQAAQLQQSQSFAQAQAGEQAPTIPRTKNEARRFDGGVPKRKIANPSAQTLKIDPEEAKRIGSIPPAYPPQNAASAKSAPISFADAPKATQREQELQNAQEQNAVPPASAPQSEQQPQQMGVPQNAASGQVPAQMQGAPTGFPGQQTSQAGAPAPQATAPAQQMPSGFGVPQQNVQTQVAGQNMPANPQQAQQMQQQQAQNDFFASYSENNAFKMPPQEEEAKRGFFKRRKKSKKENKAE